MRPKKLTQEQIDKIMRANNKHTMFTFDMSHPFYYVIDNVFKDSRKNLLVYFSKEESKLVYIEIEGNLNTEIVQNWIKEYKKGREDVKEKKREVARKARESKKSKTPQKKTQTKNNTAKPVEKSSRKTPTKKTQSKTKNNTTKPKTTKKKSESNNKKGENGEAA